MRISICVPCYRDPAFRFAVSLVGLVGHTIKTRPDIDLSVHWRQGTLVSQARNQLLQEAVERGADAVLFCDADHDFPHDALVRLLSHALEVVGVNAALRAEPTGPSAANIGPDGQRVPVWTTRETAAAGFLEQVGRIGMGMVLIRMSILEKLKATADARGEPVGPLFHFRLSDDGALLTGEDYYFCERLEAAGISVYVDHGLSAEVGHVTERLLYPADTEIVRIVEAAKRRTA